jgi:hypothetical protein
MSNIFWDRRLKHLQFTDIEVGRRTAQVQNLHVIKIFPCDRTQIVMSFGVAECFWDLRSRPAKKLWNMTNSASSTLRFLLSPRAVSKKNWYELVGYRRPYRPQEERAVTDQLKEIWKNAGGKFVSEVAQKAWIQHPNRSVVMTFAPIDISRIVRCDEFSRAISTPLVGFLQTDPCAPCLSKFPPWKRQSTHMQFNHFWMTLMAFNWIV